MDTDRGTDDEVPQRGMDDDEVPQRGLDDEVPQRGMDVEAPQPTQEDEYGTQTGGGDSYPPASSTKHVDMTTQRNEGDGTGYLGPRRKRILILGLLLLWVCAMVLPRWIASWQEKNAGNGWVVAWRLDIGGTIIMIVGLFFILTSLMFENSVAFCANRLVRLVFTAILLFGGFLYWVGGIQFAKSINSTGGLDPSHKYHYSGWAGTAFIEATFIGLFACAIGMDYLTNFMSKSERIRTYLVLNLLLSFVSLVGFFSYAAWRGYGVPGLHIAKTSCVAAGWFFVFFACIYWFVVEFVEICCRCSATAQRHARDKRDQVRKAGAVILIFGAFVAMVGMWSMSTLPNKRWNCYYVGYGFFIFFYCIVLALDFLSGERR